MAIEYHEPPQELREETRDIHRALSTLAEELEAIDWYQHRIDVTSDEHLSELFEHNRNEEMEHAAMTLEWLRRTIPALDQHLRTYLFTEGPVTSVEEEETSSGGNGAAARGLGIGSLRVTPPAGKEVS